MQIFSKVAGSGFTRILRRALTPLTSLCFLFALIRPLGLIGARLSTAVHRSGANHQWPTWYRQPYRSCQLRVRSHYAWQPTGHADSVVALQDGNAANSTRYGTVAFMFTTMAPVWNGMCVFGHSRIVIMKRFPFVSCATAAAVPAASISVKWLTASRPRRPYMCESWPAKWMFFLGGKINMRWQPKHQATAVWLTFVTSASLFVTCAENVFMSISLDPYSLARLLFFLTITCLLSHYL